MLFFMICNLDVVCLHWIEVRNKVLEGKRKSVWRVFKCMCVYVVCVCVHGVYGSQIDSDGIFMDSDATSKLIMCETVCMDHRFAVMI